MASLRTSFEKELRNKLTLKATAHQTEENILLKSLKYFDLNNSGKIDRTNFLKAVEKIGITISNQKDFYDLFDFYDTDKSGYLDYKEFAAILFGNASAVGRKNSPQKADNVAFSKSGVEAVEESLEKFRRKLKDRGGNGILGLGRQFRIFDDNNNRELDLYEFKKAVTDFGVGLYDNEIQTVFEYFDRNRSGTINYDEFLLGVRGPMNAFRRKLVNQAFDKFDRDGSGFVNIDDLTGLYNAKMHPEVRAGKKSEEDVFREFIQTFENYSDIRGIGDGRLSREEFEDYYTFISSSIDNDQYFELMINNAWRMNEGANRRWDEKGWSNTQGGAKEASLQDNYQRQAAQKRPQTGTGASPYKPNQSQVISPQKQLVNSSQVGGRAEVAKRAAANQPDIFPDVMSKIRAKLATRGTRGFVGIQRQFKIMDDDYDRAINYQEFQKAMRDYKVELSEAEIQAVFREIDRDGNGKLSIDELVRSIQGEMNAFRKGLVSNIFNRLDKDNDGVVRVNDIKGVYSAKKHPDVVSGKRTEDEVLGEFLETFEMHHNLKGGAKDQNVTREEFQEYYNNVSANIDNDQYFELMLINGYKLYNDPNTQYQQYAPAGGRKDYDPKGWAADYSDGKNKSKTVAMAPFGTSNEPQNYSTNLRPNTGTGGARREEEKRAAAGVSAWPGSRPKTQAGAQGVDVNDLVARFRNKCASRGVRGIISLGKLFRICDDDNSKLLSSYEFRKCLNDYRLEFNDQEADALFKHVDRDRSGQIDYDEFLRMIRGPMNDNRKKWVDLAFKKLDKTGNGVVDLDDIRGVYNAKFHPDVKSGKKSEDEILGEFLETFETHHAVMTGDFKLKDRSVTFEEFVEYYNNVSVSVDDDRYWELMMKNAWNFDNVSYKKGWAADL